MIVGFAVHPPSVNIQVEVFKVGGEALNVEEGRGSTSQSYLLCHRLEPEWMRL